MHKILRCTCSQIPPPPLFFYFRHHNQSLCNSAIDVIFQSSCVAIMLIAFPTIYCYSPLYFLFVFVSSPVLWSPCLLPLPSSIFVYGICLLLHSLFYLTSHKVSLSSIFPLTFCPYFVAVGCSIICFFVLLPLRLILCKLIMLAVFIILPQKPNYCRS